MKKLLIILSMTFFLAGCDLIERVLKDTPPYTEEEAADAIRDALRVGIQNVSRNLSEEGAYLNNEEIRIPFPPELSKVKSTLEGAGITRPPELLERNMNRAAEEAANAAQTVFTNTISRMTVREAVDIVNGADNAATEYLKEESIDYLRSSYSSIVRKEMNNFGVLYTWENIRESYNNLPFTDPVEMDLEAYVVNRALHGLFLHLEREEKEIRENPAARTTQILRKVFGSPY